MNERKENTQQQQDRLGNKPETILIIITSQIMII